MGTLPAHSFPGVRRAPGDNYKERGTEFVGKPDGPDKFIPSLGVEVPTFIDPCDDMRLPKDSGTTWLMYHVPRNQRGYYQIPDLPAAYLLTEEGKEFLEARCDDYGYVFCTELTQSGTPCKRRAVNKSGRCIAHGGKLHPKDKVRDERRAEAARAAGREDLVEAVTDRKKIVAKDNTELEVYGRMTRWQQLLSGVITVDDLDDEELVRCQCRDSSGGFTGSPPRMIPKALKDQMVKRVFNRVNEVFQQDLISAAQSMVQLANSEVVEPADRIKAATWVLERMLGKTPEVIVHGQEKPWEVALSGVVGGSRAVSRVARSIADEEEIWEAELVEKAKNVIVRESADGHKVADWDDQFDPEDPVQNPGAGLEDEDDPLDTPAHIGVDETPARDPYNRNNEIFRAEQERLRIVEEAKRLKGLQKDAQRRRIIARAQGHQTVRPVAFLVTTTKMDDGTYKHRFRMPRVSTPKRRRVDS